MLKSIFLLITTVILFTGCHRFHHSAVVAVPAIILSPFFIRPYHHGYTRGYHGHRRGR